MINKRFGRLVVVEELDERVNQRIILKCKCDCGKSINVKKVYLTTGSTRSCGCLKKEVEFPIITFDDEDSPDSGTILDSRNDREDILSEAFSYFELLHDDSGVWEYDEYNIFEESDLLRFENKENEVIGHVTINEDENVIEDLNNGADPILDGWEDGNGNEVRIEGWNL